MDPSLIIDESETFQTGELSDLFGVTRQTIQNWSSDGTLNCDRNQEGDRIFHGRSLIADINNSSKLRKKLRKSQDLEVEDETYSAKLENKVIEQDNRIEDLEEEKEELREFYSEIISFLKDQIEEKDKQIRFLEKQLEKNNSQTSLEPTNRNDNESPSILRLAAQRIPLVGRLVP